jgi:quinoprotein glucose dehydrogenase
MRKLILILVSVAISPSNFKPAEAPNSLVYDWPSWGGDDGGQRYSPLKQIDKTNVGRLRRAWTFHTGEISDGKNYPTKSAFECTPIVLDGVMYITTPFCRVVALDPETGKEFWSFDPKMDRMTRRNMWAHRGLAVWKKERTAGCFQGLSMATSGALTRERESRSRVLARVEECVTDRSGCRIRVRRTGCAT